MSVWVFIAVSVAVEYVASAMSAFATLVHATDPADTFAIVPGHSAPAML